MELYNQGLIDREIGEKLGSSRSLVWKHRKRLGLKNNGSNRVRARVFTDQQLIDLHEQGLVDREIAEKLGVHQTLVCTYRNRLGLKTNGSNRRFTDQQLIDLHKQGLIDREIGEKLGSSRALVGIHRKRLGLKTVTHS